MDKELRELIEWLNPKCPKCRGVGADLNGNHCEHCHGAGSYVEMMKAKEQERREFIENLDLDPDKLLGPTIMIAEDENPVEARERQMEESRKLAEEEP